MPLTFSSAKSLLLACAIVLGCVASADAQPRLRVHTATEAEPLSLMALRDTPGGAEVAMQIAGRTRIITSNGMPSHEVGTFPNSGNPNRISAQSYRFEMPISPQVRQAQPLPRAASFGVAVNGVPFDPNAAEFWQGDPRSGWSYNALGGAVALGLDANYAHVQPTGAYHYHGLPVGLMQQLGWSASDPSPLIGFAADGFPIYALTAEVNGAVVRMTSSYQLKTGQRPGGSEPGGMYDGAFMQDYAYVAGSGTLDECNGAQVTTAEFPQGTYAYFLTDAYPTVPRCLKGEMGSGFTKRP
ncbi:YHYH protein [Tateyamaria omphalii]|uniref:YHYH protein n=1 Tax=Tateyamaria omphalii TaxID=299262 RepID=UPI001C99EBC5|nr:YHYH protein [Tateyamaria omphalii]MBY5932111.1 YHYH protein [Tateyamaria omphalii]